MSSITFSFSKRFTLNENGCFLKQNHIERMILVETLYKKVNLRVFYTTQFQRVLARVEEFISE